MENNNPQNWENEKNIILFRRNLFRKYVNKLRHHYRARNWTFDENHFLVSS